MIILTVFLTKVIPLANTHPVTNFIFHGKITSHCKKFFKGDCRFDLVGNRI